MDKVDFKKLLFFNYLSHELHLSKSEEDYILLEGNKSEEWFSPISNINNFSYLTPVKLASTIDYIMRDSYYTGRYRYLYDFRFFLTISDFEEYESQMELKESMCELHRAIYSLNAVYGEKNRRFLTLMLIRLIEKLSELKMLNLSQFKKPNVYINLDDDRFFYELSNAVKKANENGYKNLEKMFQAVLQRTSLEIRKIDAEKFQKLDPVEIEKIIADMNNVDSERVFVMGSVIDNRIGYRMFGVNFKNFSEAISSKFFCELTGLIKGFDKTGLDQHCKLYYVII